MTELEAIQTRHSVRKYLDKPIEQEKVKATLLEAGYVYSEEQEQFRPIGYDEN